MDSGNTIYRRYFRLLEKIFFVNRKLVRKVLFRSINEQVRDFA